MSEVEQNKDYNINTVGNNNQGYNTANALHLRLNTDPLIYQFKIYLLGKDIITTENPKSGQIEDVIVWEGKPVVNQLGFQRIMQFMNLVINPQTVQGNFTTEDAYTDFLCRCRMDLATDLIVNKKRYALDSKDYPGLMSSIMRLIEIFMTRQIFNEERKGYGQNLKVSETVQTQPTRTGFLGISNPFGGRR